MKKLWQAMLITALAGLAVNAYADVQNIRLSGDIRVRGYYTVNHDGDDSSFDDAGQVKNSDSYISQRTRISVEADLEDHVLIVVTLKAEGLWGQDNDAGKSSGAGSRVHNIDYTDEGSGGADDRDGQDSNRGQNNINRRWELGVTEAYVQFSEMFYSPVTLKLGRQYLHYGRGLIFSSVEQEYNFDAARLVLDYYPTTIDVVYAALLEKTPFGGSNTDDWGGAPNDTHLLFLNARHELTDSFIKNIEGYYGWVINSRGGDELLTADDPLNSTSTRVPPALNGASLMIIGARADMTLTDNLDTWVEGAFEWGPDGFAGSETVEAFIANAGFSYSLNDVDMNPVINGGYTYASGGGQDGKNVFRPWFDYSEGYNGYLFSPMLSNIHIFNIGASVTPYENTTLSVQGYYYMKVDHDSPDDLFYSDFAAMPASNLNIDNGGLGYSQQNSSHDVGWEVDGILTYDYSKDVSFQLIYGVFIPGNAFEGSGSSVAHEVRAEVNARF